MTITQTGSTQIFTPTNLNSGTISSTITVPADAQIAVVFISGYQSATVNYFSAGSMTFTKGGSQVAMTSMGGEADSTTPGTWMAAGFYLAGIDTGANKTLNWDWLGTNTATNSPMLALMFFKGIDTVSPVRDTGGVQAGGLPYTSSTLTAQTGDLVAAAACWSTGSEGTINSWSNLALLQQLSLGPSNADMALASNTAPTGNMTVAASTGTNVADGGLIAIVLEPAIAPASIYMGCALV